MSQNWFYRRHKTQININIKLLKNNLKINFIRTTWLTRHDITYITNLLQHYKTDIFPNILSS